MCYIHSIPFQHPNIFKISLQTRSRKYSTAQSRYQNKPKLCWIISEEERNFCGRLWSSGQLQARYVHEVLNIVRTAGFKSTFEANSFAKAAFGLVNLVYEVSVLKAGHQMMRLTVFCFLV